VNVRGGGNLEEKGMKLLQDLSRTEEAVGRGEVELGETVILGGNREKHQG